MVTVMKEKKKNSDFETGKRAAVSCYTSWCFVDPPTQASPFLLIIEIVSHTVADLSLRCDDTSLMSFPNVRLDGRLFWWSSSTWGCGGLLLKWPIQPREDITKDAHRLYDSTLSNVSTCRLLVQSYSIRTEVGRGRVLLEINTQWQPNAHSLHLVSDYINYRFTNNTLRANKILMIFN